MAEKIEEHTVLGHLKLCFIPLTVSPTSFWTSLLRMYFG